MDSNLGRGYDDIDIFGLNEYGDPEGLGALWGASIGVGVSTLTAIGGRSFGGMTVKTSELLGLGAGVVAGGIMAFFRSTRHAGWTAIAASVLGSGLRALEGYFSSTGHFMGLGMPSLQPMPRFQPGMNGPMGIVQAQPMNGLGNPSRLQLMGGPKVSPIATRWGASYLRPNG